MYFMPSLHAFASTQYAHSSYTSRKKGTVEIGSQGIEVFERSLGPTPTYILERRSVRFVDPRRSSSRSRGINHHGERSTRRTETSSGRPSYQLVRRRDSHPSGSIYIRRIPGYARVGGECFEHPRLWGVTTRTRSAGVRSTVDGEYTKLLCTNVSRDRMGSANEISVPTT